LALISHRAATCGGASPFDISLLTDDEIRYLPYRSRINPAISFTPTGRAWTAADLECGSWEQGCAINRAYQDEQLRFERVQKGNLDMAIADSSHPWRPSKARTIAVLAGFGILHVVGGYMLHHAPSIRPIETAPTAIHGD
jgi:hypothetical protein